MSTMLAKTTVLDAAAKFVELAKEVKEDSAVEHIKPQLAQYQLGLFRIVVVGEIKKGKSSFINALLGSPDLLPTASDVATSTVYKLIYGEEKSIKVFGLPADPESSEAPPPPIQITPEQLAEYGTEKGNPNNEKRVDFVGIELPNPMLKQGVAIIDTPGLGGLFRKHRDITWRYVPNADAIFFVLDSVESVISQAEVSMLLELRKKNPLMFFVQTKIDLVEESQWKKWRERNLSVLSEKLGIPADKLIYFPVSAKLKFAADANHSGKHLERSGYSDLLYFLHNKLLAHKEDQMGRRLLSAIANGAAGIHRKLGDAVQIAATQTKEGLDALERLFIETKAKYERWKHKEFQSAIAAFQDRAAELKRKTRETLQERLDPSPSSELVSGMVGQLRGCNADAEAINEGVDRILGTCLDCCSQIIFDIQGQYNDEMHAIVKELSSSLGKSLGAQMETPVVGAAKISDGRLNMQFSDFENARNMYYGFSAGTGMAGTVVGALATGAYILGFTIATPVAVALGIATLLGGVFGAYKSKEDYKMKRKDEALTKLQSLLSDAVRRAQSKAIRQFDAISAEYEKGVRNDLRRATSEAEKEMADSIQSIADQRQRSQEEAKAKTGELKKALAKTESLLGMLKRLLEKGVENT